MRVVVALGGNALARRGDPISAEKLRQNIQVNAAALAQVARDHELVVTHGNGPQVGLLALQDLAYPGVPPYPLDILGAESQGMIGYPLQLALRNELGDHKGVATILTTTLVSLEDPDFADPTKFVGPQYSLEDATRAAAEYGWQVKPDGDAFRRVVPSPDPLAVLEAPVIRQTLDGGRVVIAVGGGGIPVAIQDGQEIGVEAVVDKDLASERLAEELGADALVILTDTDYVVEGWGGPNPRNVLAATPSALSSMPFAAGSMGPKVTAACRFAERGGVAMIGPLERLAEVLDGRAGTRVSKDVEGGIVYAN